MNDNTSNNNGMSDNGTVSQDAQIDFVSQLHHTNEQQPLIDPSDSTTIDMDILSPTPSVRVTQLLHILLHEARPQSAIQTSYPSSALHTGIQSSPMYHSNRNIEPFNNLSNNRSSWRDNLNNVPSRIRTLISHSSGLRYNATVNGDNENRRSHEENNLHNDDPNRIYERNFYNTTIENDRLNNINNQQQSISGEFTSGASGTLRHADENSTEHVPETLVNVSQPNNNNNNNNNNGGYVNVDEDAVISELFVKILNHFVRYLPFLCIIFVKFANDHSVGILDICILQCIFCYMNKSLKEEIAKNSQRNVSALLRYLVYIAVVVIYRIFLNGINIDGFGMIINPPMNSDAPNVENLISMKVIDRNSLSLGTLIYYVAVNDLILKLTTIFMKILVTLVPSKFIKSKPKARTYKVIEHVSQTYRCIVPSHQWLIYLLGSYSGPEIISATFCVCLYLGAKGFEIYERGRHLKHSIINLVRNANYVQPSQEELEATDSLCPICHDSYNNPIMLECTHIFCDDCVNTWFKNDPSCPMCRAKIKEDPTWQNGATSFFYQIF